METLRALGKPQTMLSLFACSMSRMISLGLVGCTNVYYDSIREEFQSSHFTTSLLFAIGLGIMQGSGLLVTFLLKRWSERTVVVAGGLVSAFGVITSYFATSIGQIMISMGVIHSFGQGLGFVASTVAASFVMEEKFHHVAISLQNVGNALGILVFPVLFEKLIAAYGWRGSLLTLTGISLNQCVCGLLMDTPDIRRFKEMAKTNDNLPPPPSPIYEEDHEAFYQGEENPAFRFPKKNGLVSRLRGLLPSGEDLEIWRDARFLFLLTNAFTHCFSYSIYFLFAYTHMLSQGVAADSAAWVFSSYAVASIVARITTAFLDNRCIALRRWFVFGYGHFLAGAAVLVFSQLRTPDALYYSIVMAFVGFANGLIDPLICCVALDILGPQKLADSFSFLMCFWGIGGFSGAAVGGMIRDQLSSFAIPLAIASCGEVLASFALVPLKFFSKYYQENLACRNKELLAVKDSEGPVRTSLMHLHFD